MPTYTLYYFDCRGQAEVSRLLFAAAGVKYIDKRFNKDSWLKFKAHTPTGQLPCLQIDDRLYSQSVPIALYLANEFGFHGRTNEECLAINEVIGISGDVKKLVGEALFTEDKAKQEELFAALKKEHVPRFSRIFEKLLARNQQSGGFFVGNRMTLADIIVFDTLERGVKEHPEMIQGCPRLKSNMDKVLLNSGINTWLQTRPKTEM